MVNKFTHTINFKILRRIGFLFLLLFCFVLFVVWRIDNPRAERIRMALIDKFVPNIEFILLPVAKFGRMIQDFQSYERIYTQNQELRNELQKMKAWREAALQLEQENARLLNLNKVKLDPKLSVISGKVLTDSGSRFRQTALINLGRIDGLNEGWAAMDGLGLVGRITGIGEQTARVLFVTDTSSLIPVTIKPSNNTALLAGDNTKSPKLIFIENIREIQPGDRIVTSGDGGVFPANLLVGQVGIDHNNHYRAFLAADFQRLEFLRVIRFIPQNPITQPERLIGPIFLNNMMDK